MWPRVKGICYPMFRHEILMPSSEVEIPEKNKGDWKEGKWEHIMFPKRREPIVPRRWVTSQTSNEPLRKPKTRILLYVRKECAALTVRLRREAPEEESVLFRYVLFTVWTLQQSEADMKYLNMKWRGNLVNLVRFLRNWTQKNHCALWATPYRCFWKADEWENANR